jgi:RimK family alpha-L-glutamate ligase
MNIVLATTKTSLEENERIKEEVLSLGHNFSLLDISEFEYSIVDGYISSPSFAGLNPDIVIVRGIFNEIKPIAMYVKTLRSRGVRVFDNNFSEHLYSINKIADGMKLAQAGIPVPDTFHLHSYESFLASAEKIGYPVIAKLARTGKGAGVYKFDNKNALMRFLANLQKRGVEAKSYILQEFIPYVHDLRVLIIGDSVFCMKRIPGEGEFRANFSLGGSVELFDLDEAGRDLAIKALKAVNLSVAGVDMLIDGAGKRYILEVNHTPGFLGMEKATGKNIGRIWVENAISQAR